MPSLKRAFFGKAAAALLFKTFPKGEKYLGFF